MSQLIIEFESEEEAMQMIIKVCEYLKWDIAVPDKDGDAPLDGLVIGKSHYVENILKDD